MFPRAPPGRERPTGKHAFAQRIGACARDGAQQFVRPRPRHVKMDVDTVHEGPAYTPLIGLYACGRTAAWHLGIPEIAAGTWIACRKEHETRRESQPVRRSHQAHLPRLEGLTNALKHRPLELRQLVKEQHAVMSERNLPRPRRIAAADKACQRRAVMRGAERTHARERMLGTFACDRVHQRGLQALVFVQRRKDRGHARSKHRLARSRRSHHEQA